MRRRGSLRGYRPERKRPRSAAGRPPLGRLAALVVLLIAAVAVAVTAASACTGGDDAAREVARTPRTPLTPRPNDSATPAATDAPTASPTATPVAEISPGETLRRFLVLWASAKYSDMYDLLSTTAMERIPRKDFVQRYADIAEEAGIESVEGTLTTTDTAASLQSYSVTLNTAAFGAITEANAATLVKEDRWRIDWNPSLIFKDLSGTNLVHFAEETPRRGTISDRNGQPLAIEATVTVVGVAKGFLGDRAETVRLLSEKLGMPEEEINTLIDVEAPDYYFIPLKTLPYNTDPAVVADISATVSAAVISESSTRVYPESSLAAHVIGYMNKISAEELEELKAEGYTENDMIGRAGVEGEYERVLAGSRGAKLSVISPEGATVAVIAERPAEPGRDIYLSIDIRAQRLAEEALGQRAGATVLLDPSDNSVVAMASWPRFDPNRFITGLTVEELDKLLNDPLNPFLNRAVEGLYPPGSTFKAITAAAGLERGGFTAGSSFPCPAVWYGLGEANAKKNWFPGNEGNLTIPEGLMRSCNPVFYQIALTLDGVDPNILPSFAAAFGLGRPTGVLGIHEEAGIAPGPAWKEQNQGEPWYTGDSVNMGIGQGFLLVTPLQVANAYSAIASSATLRKPVLVTRIVASEGPDDTFAADEVNPLPVSQATLDTVRDGLRKVTSDPRGTAANVFAGSSLTFAGKSGTAEDAGVSDHVWFVAYAPREAPAAVCVVVFDDGKSGSQEAGPVVRKIIEGWLLGG